MSAVCDTLLIRDGNLIIRDGFLILCDPLEVPVEVPVGVSSGAAGGGLPFPLVRGSDERKRDVDIAVAELLLLSRKRFKEE